MEVQRVDIRHTKECLHLKFEAGMSHEKIARALQLSKGVVSKYIKAARDTGIACPALALLYEATLGAAMVPSAKIVYTGGDRVLLDVSTLHSELRRKGLTLLLLWGTQFFEHYGSYVRTIKRSIRQLRRAG